MVPCRVEAWFVTERTVLLTQHVWSRLGDGSAVEPTRVAIDASTDERRDVDVAPVAKHRNVKLTKSTEDVVLRRPPSKPPRTFTASVIVDADTDADVNTDGGSTAARKSVLSDTDIFRLIRTASATHKKSDTDDVSKHDETNDVAKRTDDDKKRTSTKSSTSSASSSSDDESNDVTTKSRKEQSSKNKSKVLEDRNFDFESSLKSASSSVSCNSTSNKTDS